MSLVQFLECPGEGQLGGIVSFVDRVGPRGYCLILLLRCFVLVSCF